MVWYEKLCRSRRLLSPSAFGVDTLFYVNTMQLSPEGEVNSSGGYISRHVASRYISALTDLERDNCFSIYQISWIKIRKELSVNKRRHLVRVCLRFNWQCFGDDFLWFHCNSVRILFLSTSKRPANTFSWYLLVQMLHLPLKFHLSKLSRNKKPFWIPSQNSEYPRIFRVTGANQNAQKLLSTDLVNTNCI